MSQSSPQSTTSRITSPSRYSKATHLTEFYPYLNGGLQQSNTSLKESQYKSRPGHSREQSQSSTIDSFTSFTPSTFDFKSLVTQTDIQQTTESFNDILQTSLQYNKALLAVSEAAGNFGVALEKSAKCKGAGTSADGLLSASGLFFLIANHQQILAHSVEEVFHTPIEKEVSQFKDKTERNDLVFKSQIKERVKQLKTQERENAKLSKLKNRNLITYRSKLLQLTSQIDEIDRLKHDYYQSSFDIVQHTSNNILTKLGSIVRAQVEIYEGIARKGWSGGGLDDLIAQCPDPFAQEEYDELYDDLDDPVKRVSTPPNKSTRDEDNEDSDDETIEAQYNTGALKTSNGEGLVLRQNDKYSATEPVLSHQQSIRTFQTDSLVASTPIRTRFNDALNNDNNNYNGSNNDELNKDNKNNNNSKDNTHTNDDTFDDNSFSLPIPGSSRGLDNSQLKNITQGLQSEISPVETKLKVETDGLVSGIDDVNLGKDENNESIRTPPSQSSPSFSIHNEWRDSLGEK